MIRGRTLLAASIAVALAVASMAVAAASNCKMVQIAELPVRLAHNKLIVDGAINGQKIGVILDTGAMHTLIVRSAAVRLGLARQEARGYRVFGIGGETHVEAALVDEFKIGQATRKGWRMLVAGEHDPGDDVAVLLGEDFFDQVDVEFDLAHKAVRLFQPKDCDRVSLAYWASGDIGEVEIDAVHDVSPRIILTVLINGQPVRAQLDSGAGTSVLDKTDAARLGVTPDTPGVVTVGSGAGGLGQKSVDYWIGPFQSFVIGDEIIRDTTILFGDLWKNTTYTRDGGRVPQKVEGTPAMLLGADFLRAHRLLVAHSQRKIYFSYAGGPVFQPTGALETTALPKNQAQPRPSSPPGAHGRLSGDYPIFPQDAIRAGVSSGRVVARLLITPQGTVSKVHIVESTPPGIFDAAVTDALTHWTFEATGGTYIAEVPINFVLKQ